ncbi:MAG: DEAD/DEAH box helicase [bacterium]
MDTHSFAELGLCNAVLAAVGAEGYQQPTPIQSRAIPVLLQGGDVIATAQTGTGKTAAFTLPLIHTLTAGGAKGNAHGAGRGDAAQPDTRNGAKRNAGGRAWPRALILAPTRELAIQIDESVATYSAGSRLSHTVVFGGASKNGQLTQLRQRPTVLVATPGRLLDFIGEGAIDLSAVEVLVIDEADRMLDMGFIPDVRRIAKRTENRRQTAMFSATMPPQIEELAQELLKSPTRLAVTPKKVTVDAINQTVMHLAREDKPTLLPQLIRDRGMFRVLVFTKTKHKAARVAKTLAKGGIPSAEIHGNRTQNQRQRALEGFRSGKVQALVGTDVAARGIDVDDITHVINYEIPHEPETYVHRIGRTARAGAAGEAISMCDADELKDFRQIERLLKRSVTVDREHAFHAEPAAEQRGGRQQPHGGSRSPVSASPKGSGPQKGNGGGKGGGHRNDNYPGKGRNKGSGQPGGRAPSRGHQKGGSRSRSPRG